MEWWLLAIFLFGGLILILATGIPIAFGFGLLNVLALFFLMGGVKALAVLTYSGYYQVASFLFIAVPLFLLLGNFVLYCGISDRMIEGVSTVMSGIRGSLFYASILAAVIFAAVSGSSMASCAALGSVLIPEAEKRKYDTAFMLGLIAGGGPLAILIPPSGLMVVFAGISGMSVSDLLIGGIAPGLLVALLLTIYVTVAMRLRPQLCPPTEGQVATLRQRSAAFVRLLPLGLIMFGVIGLIFLGITTPSEAAATGALAAFVLAIFYRGLNWTSLRKSTVATVRTSGMILMILVGSRAYSEILAYTGCSKGLVAAITGLPLPPVGILVCMLVIILFLGCFMDQLAIMFITVPIYFPVFRELGINPLWAGLTMMVGIEIGTMTPPFGVNLFVLKSLAPKGMSLMGAFRHATPFAFVHILGMFLMVVFPAIALWLPSHIMK